MKKKQNRIYSDTYGAKYQRKVIENNKQYVSNKKIEIGKCQKCNWFDENCLSCMEFDHIDENDKIVNVTVLMNNNYNTLKKLEVEISKCRLLCANCHLKRTNRQFNRPILEVYAKYQAEIKKIDNDSV